MLWGAKALPFYTLIVFYQIQVVEVIMNTIKNLAVLFVFILAVISCTLPAAEERTTFINQAALELEILYGFKLAKESIVITVVSTGRRAPMYEQIRIPLDHSKKNDHFRILNSVKMKP